MLGFWLAAGGMTLVAVGFVLARLVVPRRARVHAEPREANLAALKASWAELERDRAAGILPEDQCQAARDDLARRADEEHDEGAAPVAMRPAWVTAAVAAVLIPAAAFAFYAHVGNPDAIGTAAAFRQFGGPLTAEQAPAFRDRLANHLADNPGDARAWALLGRMELALDRFPEAEAAFGRAVADRKVSLDPGIWCDYADAAGLAQGGRLEGKPATLVEQALALDASHPRALEMAGSLAIERHDFASAGRYWRSLLAQLPEGGSQRRELARAVERVERLAIESPNGVVPRS